LVAEIGQFWNCDVELEETSGHIFNWRGENVGWIQYDSEACSGLSSVRLCALGRKRDREEEHWIYYVLVLKPGRSGGEFERIGWARVDARNVSRLGIIGRIL
jgi:hypothetical protein